LSLVKVPRYWEREDFFALLPSANSELFHGRQNAILRNDKAEHRPSNVTKQAFALFGLSGIILRENKANASEA
jgi:hypothetical protein